MRYVNNVANIKPKQKFKRAIHLNKRFVPKRNGRHYDTWSLMHLFMGAVFGLAATPLAAMFFLVLWEPVEILLISPFLARHKISFGYESINISLSDIAFDALGVMIGYYILRAMIF